MPPGVQGLEIPAMGNFFRIEKPLSRLVAVAIQDGTEGKDPHGECSGAELVLQRSTVLLDTPRDSFPCLRSYNAWQGKRSSLIVG